MIVDNNKTKQNHSQHKMESILVVSAMLIVGKIALLEKKEQEEFVIRKSHTVIHPRRINKITL